MLQTASADAKKANATGKTAQAREAPDGMLAPPVAAELIPQRGLHPRAGTPPAYAMMQSDRPGGSGTEQHRSPLATLHKSIGNQAVLRMLNRSAPTIQAKLAVNQPGDAFEQEADRVADRVMRMTNPAVACSSSSRDANRSLQRAAAAPAPSAASTSASWNNAAAPPMVGQVLNAPGQPLAPPTRDFMETRFGHHFSQVRVHTGPTAAESARSISALAFTSAHHIVFGSGQYSPGTSEGRKLLAHELTHVLQQGTGESVIQRDEAPVDVAAKAGEVEQLVRPGNDENEALDTLKALDMVVLLKVVEQLYEDAGSGATDEGKRRAFGLLNGDLTPPVAGAAASPGQSLTDAERSRLQSAFDAAPTKKLRNPTDTDKGTDPTLSESRKLAAPKGPVRPGDWGEDPADNTWVAHVEGIRTYFGSPVIKELRTSTWLGNNPSNFDYTPAFTKRAIGSFHWGHGVHHFAIYLNEADAGADLRDRMRPYTSIIAYIRVHLGNNKKDNNRSPEAYVRDMQRGVAAVKENDPAKVWTEDDGKWADLMKGFKAAEGWKEGKIITTDELKNLSSDPKNAALVDYYQKLLGSTP
jgi:hypothetical protein